MFVFYIENCNYALLASFIKPCRRSDAEFTTCLTNAVQAALPFMADGLPEAGIPSVDPLKVENIKVNQPALKIQFDDGYILGLKSCKVNEFRYSVFQCLDEQDFVHRFIVLIAWFLE